MTFKDGSAPVQFEAVDDSGNKSPSILKFEGAELTVCVSTVGGYPDTFEPGPDRMVVKYRRDQ